MKIKYPALYIVRTVHGDTPCCLRHAEALGMIMRYLGSSAEIDTANEDLECSNCRNEKLKKELIT
jgi:hypothetical protein